MLFKICPCNDQIAQELLNKYYDKERLRNFFAIAYDYLYAKRGQTSDACKLIQKAVKHFGEIAKEKLTGWHQTMYPSVFKRLNGIT